MRADQFPMSWVPFMSEKTTAVAVKADLESGPFVSTEQLQLVKTTVAKDATTDELKLYLYDCRRQGVHPLDRLLHFTKRGGKYTPVTSIDLMRIRAAETGEYAGSDDAVFGDLIENKFPISATVTVWRLVQGQRCAFTATARWSEYKPDGQDFMWKKMPATMLGKCAEALALRKGFPKQLAGLYAKEEMDQASEARPVKAVVPSEPTAVAADGIRTVRGSGTDSHVVESEAPIDALTNPYTGEVYPPLREGFCYVWKYELDEHGWHHGWISVPHPEGGMSALEIKTRTEKGRGLQVAADDKLAVKLRWNDKAYLMTIEQDDSQAVL